VVIPIAMRTIAISICAIGVILETAKMMLCSPAILRQEDLPRNLKGGVENEKS